MLKWLRNRFSVKFLAGEVDPVTGDILTPSERISRVVQVVMRRWSFIGIITIVTAIWWTHGDWFRDPQLFKWNLGASYLALLIESAVGIGMFNQTLRDAVVLRSIKRTEERVIVLEERILRKLGDDDV